jgi:DegV family protein with EDD domain
MAVALVTDSNANLPPAVLARGGVRVVPLVVTVEGVDFQEGVDLDPAWCYARLAAGAEVVTASPSPGRFLAAYQAAADAGASAVVSIHLGSNLSSTASSANVAKAMSPIPVELVDSGLAAYGVGWCVQAATDAIERGVDAAGAASEARATATAIGTIFVAGALSLAARGGRLAAEAVVGIGSDRVPILRLAHEGMRPVDVAVDAVGALDVMARHLAAAAADAALDVAVGDAAAPELGDGLAERLAGIAGATVVDRFELVPSLAAHLGVGAVGAVYRPSSPRTA